MFVIMMHQAHDNDKQPMQATRRVVLFIILLVLFSVIFVAATLGDALKFGVHVRGVRIQLLVCAPHLEC